MPKTSYPHRLLPPSDRYSNWQGDADAALIYLGWGERNFSNEAIPIHSSPGWTYWTLLEGEAKIAFPSGTRNYKAGQGLLCGPERPFGFPEQNHGPLKILIWIWKDSPERHEPPPLDLDETVAFSKDQLRLLSDLHQQTRAETLESPAPHHDALLNLRQLVDLTYYRGRQAQSISHEQSRVRSARLWMLHNLSSPTPAATLARFLNISPMTLHRLFKSELGESPGTHFQTLKMEQARRLLQHEGQPIKGVAYELGYKHPQDFSRAYKNHFGAAPSK